MRHFLGSSAGLLLLLLVMLVHRADAHPGSGIVVDEQGNVFFTYKGVAEVSPDGKLNQIYSARDGHWMCLDAAGSFANTQPKYGFRRITKDGEKPAIIYAGGGAPIVVGLDGNLYYGSSPPTATGEFSPGGLTVARMSPDGKISELSRALAKQFDELHDGVTGLAVGSDGVLYVACWRGILKVGMDGTVSKLAYPMTVADCDEDRADGKADNPLPYLRGIAVASDGTVYAAATSCHRVLKITPDSKVSVALVAERPWSPTGVALHGGDVYVLEYSNANQGAGQDHPWRPRVRKFASDGSVTTLVTIPPNQNGLAR